jgi:hypothetical protein
MKKSIGKIFSIVTIVILSLTGLTILPSQAFGPVTIYTPPSGLPSYACLSPRTIQLKYSGSNNGKMYTTFELTSNGIPIFPVFESTNNGQNWTLVGNVADTVDGGTFGMKNCPQLFELPQAIGSLAAGTIICVGNAVDTARTTTHMEMYKSTDLGRTWTYVSTVATGGSDITGNHTAIWEPWLLVANNKLICYISDERDVNHSQKIDHYTTTDGFTWSGPVEDVVWPDTTTRPGMPVVSKLSNGDYIMTYEVVGMSNVPCEYKINTNAETGWNACTSPIFAYGGSPYNTVLSDGRIFVQSYGSSVIYFNTSNDGSGSWVSMGTPIGSAYNREILQLASGRLFIDNGGGFSTYNSVTCADMYVPPLTGSYTFKNVNSGKVIGINGGATSNGTQAVQWTSTGAYDQMFQRVVATGSYYKLFDVKTAKVLGVYNASTADGANVVQWDDTGTNDQQWSFVAVGSYYKIVNRNSGKCLAVLGNSTTDGASLVQWTDNGTTSQQWQIVAN